MTTGELYVQAMASTQRYVDGVRPEQWTAPTPCTEWNVKQVANHVIGENLWAGELFKGKTIAQVGTAFDGDVVGVAFSGSAEQFLNARVFRHDYSLS